MWDLLSFERSVLAGKWNYKSDIIFCNNFKNKVFNFQAGLQPEIETGSIYPPTSTRPKVTSNGREWKTMIASIKIGIRLDPAGRFMTDFLVFLSVSLRCLFECTSPHQSKSLLRSGYAPMLLARWPEFESRFWSIFF